MVDKLQFTGTQARTMRENRFDWLKGLLIFLVVFAHTMERWHSLTQTSAITVSLYHFIYTFHMPAFIFISGYFSKKDYTTAKDRRKLLTTLLLPFVLAHALFWLLFEQDLPELFSPRWALWYLLCLFVWRLLTPTLAKLRFVLPFSVVLALLIGLTPAATLLSASRMVCFYPIFLAGYLMQKPTLDKIRRLPKALAWASLLIVAGLVIFLVKEEIPLAGVLMMKSSYASNKLRAFNGMALRLFALLLGFWLTCCLLILAPNRNSALSRLGRNTMPVYLAHTFVIMATRKLLALVFRKGAICPEPVMLVIELAFAALIVFIFGNCRVAKLYQAASQKLSKLLIRT